MGKHLQDKLLDAGIIPKNAVQQMERWQSVPAGSAGSVGEADPGKVRGLRKELDLQRLPTLRESILDVDSIVSKGRSVALKHGPLYVDGALAGVDRLGRYIFPIPQSETEYNLMSTLLRPMTTLTDAALPVPRHLRTITVVSVLYRTVEQDNQRVSKPTHWFCETEAGGEHTVVKGR